ncbi:MAG: hypothetical protein JST69_07680 [Bacteroidetes bacterium]|nr:hypothetical protein [Bacteroidota bacterium]
MKKITLLFALLPALLWAQKKTKPDISKAESALQKFKLDEAKKIIDTTVVDARTMVDKKGNPTKNAAKAWYLKGVIYAAIDTTKNPKFKSLEANPFPAIQEAFTKAEELDKGKNESLVSGTFPGTEFPVPLTKVQVSNSLAQAYLVRGFEIYKAKDYKKAFVDIEKVLFFVPKDTSQLMNAGVYFAPAAEEFDKAIDYIKRYQAAGGKTPEAWLQLYSIYAKRADAIRATYKGKDKSAALKDEGYISNINLALDAAKQLTSRYPTNVDYLNLEYNIYTTVERFDEAKALMEKKAGLDPKDAESRYKIGLICQHQKQDDCARHWLEEALKADPQYFDAAIDLARYKYADAQKIKHLRNDTKDAKKRLELFQEIHKKLDEALPYWERCVAIDGKSQDACDGLKTVYYDLSAYDEKYEAKIKELTAKMKANGLEVD